MWKSDLELHVIGIPESHPGLGGRWVIVVMVGTQCIQLPTSCCCVERGCPGHLLQLPQHPAQPQWRYASYTLLISQQHWRDGSQPGQEPLSPTSEETLSLSPRAVTLDLFSLEISLLTLDVEA